MSRRGGPFSCAGQEGDEGLQVEQGSEKSGARVLSRGRQCDPWPRSGSALSLSEALSHATREHGA